MENETSDHMRRHLQSVTDSSGLPPGEESYRRIEGIWTEKRKIFEAKTSEFGMTPIKTLEKDDPRGAIALTYSGSLVSVGCLTTIPRPANAPEIGRWFEYVSIKLRKDVPNIVMGQCVELVVDLRVDAVAEFTNCPIKKSSEILAIAMYQEELPAAELEQRIRDTTAAITEGFIEINAKLGLPETK